MALVRWPVLAAVVWAFLVATARGEETPQPGQAPAEPVALPQAKYKPDVALGDNPRVDLEVDPKTGLVLAAVTLNGVAGRFVLGTGSPQTLVTLGFANKTGIDRDATAVGVVGMPGGQAKAGRVRSLKVGTADFTDFDAWIVSLEQLNKHLERPADGLLGANVLLAAPVTLDYAAKRLVFGRPADLAKRKQLPADMFARHLMVQGTVDGEKLDFIIDTGLNYSTIEKSSFKGKTEQTQGVELAVPQQVLIADQAVAGQRFVLSERNILGIDFFQRYVVTLDAPDRKLYLQGGPPAVAPVAGGGTTAPRQPGQPPAESPPGPPPPPLPPAMAKQLDAIQAGLANLQDEQFKLVVRAMQSQQKVLDALGVPPEKVAEALAAGRMTKPLRDYKALLVGLIQQLRSLDARFVPIQRQVQTLAADRRAAEAKPRLVKLAGDIVTQRKNVQDKIADLCEKAGDFKAAIAIYEAEVQALTELSRTTEIRPVREKLAEAYDKAQEPRTAAAIYRSICDAMSAKERSESVGLLFRLAYMYEKAGDFRKALDVYLEAQKYIPPGQVVKGLAERIAVLRGMVAGGN